MLQAAPGPGPTKKGTSRMSKALPAVPSATHEPFEPFQPFSHPATHDSNADELHFSRPDVPTIPKSLQDPSSPFLSQQSAWPTRTDSNNAALKQTTTASSTTSTPVVSSTAFSPTSANIAPPGSVSGIARKPVAAPAPPPKAASAAATVLPSHTAPAVALAQAPSKMSIPRRPVGKTLLSTPSPIPQPEPSPAESWSSLLSYYDDNGSTTSLTSEETNSRSGNSAFGSESESARTSVSATASAAGSYRGMDAGKTWSKSSWSSAANNRSDATYDTATSNSSRNTPSIYQSLKVQSQNKSYLRHNRNQSQSTIDADLPPPPPKDDRFARSSTPTSPEDKAASSNSPAAASPSSQLWRRRSHRSNNSRDLPGLTLNYSHGSSASTASQETIKASQAISKPPAAPRAGGLPGRNVRPTKAAAPNDQTMGNEISKVKELKDKLQSSARPAEASDADRPGPQQPPTPDYLKDDITAQIIQTYASPVSPAASPDSPKGLAPNITKQLPPQPPMKDNLPKAPPKPEIEPIAPTPISRKDLTAVVAGQELHGAKNLPDIGNKSQSPPNSRPPSGRETPASDAASARARNSSNSDGRPPRNASARPDGRRPMEQPPRQLAPGSDPRIVQSETQGPCYRGRDGTLYPEMKMSQDPHPKATYFPVQNIQQSAPGSVLKSKPVNDTHYGCYQKHRMMNRRTNKNCPLTCQACDKADAEDRWVCSFCHLRICEQCLQKFNGLKRDLRSLMGEVGADAFYSSPGRTNNPGLGLGLNVS